MGKNSKVETNGPEGQGDIPAMDYSGAFLAHGSCEMGKGRIDSIDLMRGIVMVLMTLEHVRLGFSLTEPEDLTQTTFALFMTRWLSHFAPPTFVFLAGVSAYLFEQRSPCESHAKRKKMVSRFLWTRGLWLIFMELTVISFGWYQFGPGLLFQVIWVIGAGMLILSALVYAPRLLTMMIGIIMIVAHNLLDPFTPSTCEFLWSLFHQPRYFEISAKFEVAVEFPLIPWVGVMFVGYGCGALWEMNEISRKRILVTLGGTLTIAFVLLRWLNSYGDSLPWEPQSNFLMTAASFLTCQKYPPSLMYLLMALGPLFLALACFNKSVPAILRPVVVLGRVPFFYYILHIYVIYLGVSLLAWIQTGDPVFCRWYNSEKWDDCNYGLGLTGIYAVTACVVVFLYFICRWYRGIKKRNPSIWWLKYL